MEQMHSFAFFIYACIHLYTHTHTHTCMHSYECHTQARTSSHFHAPHENTVNTPHETNRNTSETSSKWVKQLRRLFPLFLFSFPSIVIVVVAFFPWCRPVLLRPSCLAYQPLSLQRASLSLRRKQTKHGRSLTNMLLLLLLMLLLLTMH